MPSPPFFLSNIETTATSVSVSTHDNVVQGDANGFSYGGQALTGVEALVSVPAQPDGPALLKCPCVSGNANR